MYANRKDRVVTIKCGEVTARSFSSAELKLRESAAWSCYLWHSHPQTTGWVVNWIVCVHKLRRSDRTDWFRHVQVPLNHLRWILQVQVFLVILSNLRWVSRFEKKTYVSILLWFYFKCNRFKSEDSTSITSSITTYNRNIIK